MEVKLNEQSLDAKLEALEKARAWIPRVISKLETFIRSADDFALFRINPLRFGLDKSIPEAEVIDLFLYATQVGLFQMTWNLMCPVCGSPVNSFAELQNLHADYYCRLCDAHTNATLDDYIQVAFTIAPAVRAISFHNLDSLTIEEFIYQYHYHRGVQLRGGPAFVDYARSVERYIAYIEPGETQIVALDLPEGILRFAEFTVDSVADTFLTEKSLAPTIVPVTFRNTQWEGAPETLPAGSITVHLTNDSNKRGAFAIFNIIPAPYPGIDFDPFLTGKRVINTQTFRDLFQTEVIQNGGGLNVQDLTVLFTDLKGSTALYDRIGDLNAFSLVRLHFERLGAVIKANSGIIVKTIGDAVMATFIDPRDAVTAALQFLKEIEELNHRLASQDVILKIGMHKGALITVTLNDRLDYFGQTVNIAARVQGLADAEEIYVTNSIYDHEGVIDLLESYQVTPSEARLKGIEREMKVYRIAYQASDSIPQPIMAS